MIYEPQEDSFLLQKFVKKYSKGLVLDMGTGSGIQAMTAAENADLVLALDINKDAIKHCNKKHKKIKNIVFLKSNLFEIFDDNFVVYDKKENRLHLIDKNKKNKKDHDFKELKKKNIKFDLIVFNPPYLPQDKGIKDDSLYGGKKGHELIYRFFRDVKKYLKQEGRIVLLFSSITGKQKVNDIINKTGMNYIELAKEHIFFEDLFVYYVTK